MKECKYSEQHLKKYYKNIKATKQQMQYLSVLASPESQIRVGKLQFFVR